MNPRKISLGFDRFSGLYLWALFIVVFGILQTDLFLTTATLHSVASSQAIVAMLGIAVMVPLATGVFDLSVGAVTNLTAVTVAVLQTNLGYDMWPSILIAVLVGVAVGALNGFLVVVLGISSFIATLATATVVGAVQAIVSNQSQPLPPTSPGWRELTQQTVFGFQIVVVYLFVLALIVWWLVEHTPAGRYMYAVGGNPEAARLSGVRVGKWVWLSFICSGLICRHRWCLVLLPERARAHLRRRPAAARVRGGFPRRHAAHSGPIQHLGHGPRRLYLGDRRPRTSAGDVRAVAQRHVQRRRPRSGCRLRRVAPEEGHRATNGGTLPQERRPVTAGTTRREDRPPSGDHSPAPPAPGGLTATATSANPAQPAADQS